MAALDQQLARWLAAGVIDASTATRIRSFEEEPGQRSGRPGIVEAVVYLGLAVIGVGVVVLVASNWEDLGRTLHIALPAFAACVALYTGYVLKQAEGADVRRGGQAAWLLAAALVAATAAVVSEESGGAAVWNVTIAAIAALPSAIALWALSKSEVQVVGIAGACVLASFGALAQTTEYFNDDYASVALGMSFVAFGGAAILFTEFDVLVPRLPARILGAMGLAAGSLWSGESPGPTWGEMVAFAAGAALIIVSIRRGVLIYMVGGVAALFIGLLTLIFRHVESPTVAALSLIGVGIVLLAGIVALERARPWQAPRGQD